MSDEQYRLNVAIREHWYAEVVRLRAEVAAQDAVIRGLADRVAAQAELLAKRAERPGEVPT